LANLENLSQFLNRSLKLWQMFFFENFKTLVNFEIFGQFRKFWPILEILATFGNFGHFWKFWPILEILANFENFGQS